MPAIETEGLTKDYLVGFWRPRPYRALDALTLQVEPGEVFGFLGPNGAGKTTTLKLLMQLILPDARHARRSSAARSATSPSGGASASSPENPYFYDYLTAEELLTTSPGCSATRGADANARVARVLDEVGLGAERRLRLRKFSKGMLQRVGTRAGAASTIPRSCFSTSRCPASIRSAAATCAI